MKLIREASLRAHPSQLERLRHDPSAARLRADPRFQALLARLGSG